MLHVPTLKHTEQTRNEDIMANINNLTITGNLTRDVELKFTQGGRSVATIGIANNRRYQVNGEWTEEVSFFNVTIWGPQAEKVAAWATKGTAVVVTGRLQQRSYDNKEGNKVSVVEIVADVVSPDPTFQDLTVARTPREGGATGAPVRKNAPASDFDMSPTAFDEEPF